MWEKPTEYPGKKYTGRCGHTFTFLIVIVVVTSFIYQKWVIADIIVGKLY